MEKECAVYRVSSFIGKRWTIPLLLELYKGKGDSRRYSELKNAVPGITPKLLSLRLKELQAEGLVQRSVDASSFPVKSEYALTESGKEFINVIGQMKRWALHWKPHSKVCEKTACRKCGL